MKVPRTHVTPSPFGSDRAEEIWAQRGIQHAVDHAMTDGEDEWVHLVWSRMPGTTSWSDAFHRIRKGELDAELERLQYIDSAQATANRAEMIRRGGSR